MEFFQPLAFPPDQEACQEIRTDFINGCSDLILDRQKIDDGDSIWNSEQQEQNEDQPANLVVMSSGNVLIIYLIHGIVVWELLCTFALRSML